MNNIDFSLPIDWTWDTLDSVGDIYAGSSAPQDEKYFIDGTFPFVRVQDLGREKRTTNLTVTVDKLNSLAVDQCHLVKAKPGTILFPKSGAAILTNNRALLGIPAYIVSHLAAIEPNQEWDEKWVFYWLCLVDMRQYINNPAYPSLNLTEIKKIPIPKPRTRQIQRQIVARIEALQSEVREMREINQRIYEDTNSLLLSTLGQLFPNPDRLLPEGWRLKTIEEISKNPQYGFTTSAKSEPVGPKFLRITDIQNGMVDWNSVPFCECNQREVDRYRLIDGDIVFARTGATTGKTFLISAPPEAVFASYLIRLQIERDASPDFVYWFFQSPYYWRQIIPRGGAQPNMNAQLLKKVKIPVPENRKIQEKLIAQVFSIQNEILQIQKDQNATEKMILDLEQAILAQAFRGEL